MSSDVLEMTGRSSSCWNDECGTGGCCFCLPLLEILAELGPPYRDPLVVFSLRTLLDNDIGEDTTRDPPDGSPWLPFCVVANRAKRGVCAAGCAGADMETFSFDATMSWCLFFLRRKPAIANAFVSRA